MSAKRGRLRKPISSARIEVEMVFTTNADFQKFGKIVWARNSNSVSHRRWISARWEDEDDPSGSLIATFQYQHTCRNEGAYRGDSEKFFRAVCNAAEVSLDNAGILETRLVHRINCIEPTPERLPIVRTGAEEPPGSETTGPVVNQWGRIEGSDLGMRCFGSLGNA